MTADGIDLAYFAGLVAGPDNAQLASAAPDMLEAIEQAAADIEDFLNYQEQQGDPMDDQFTGTLRMLKRVSERARGQQ